MSWNERGSRYYKDLERRPYSTGWVWFWAILGTGILIAIVFSIVGFASNWWSKAADVISPQNTEKQYVQVINNWEALYASAENACIAVSSNNENSPTFVESPEAAYAATFRRIVIDYNRRQANLFEAGIVGPPGYPKEVPRSLGADNDWCSVPDQLDAIQH